MSVPFGWGSVVRLGLVQACIGAIVVMATSTMNRVMVVEHGLPALVPGALVALHYLVQVVRPRMGHGSDLGARRTPWIVGGVVTLALGGVLAAVATAWMGSQRIAGIVLAVLAFVMIGAGVSASGTALLTLLAKRVIAPRRAGAATTVWLMMIVGFALTSAIAAHFLDPYTPGRLVGVAAGVSVVACALTALATLGLEGPAPAVPGPLAHGIGRPVPFTQALTQVWSDRVARRFTQFVFLSMLAYSAQELLIEPFAGAALGYTPGRSAGLSGLQHGGVLLGMLAATLAGRGADGRRFGSLTQWQVGGCLGSALMLTGLALASWAGPGWPFKLNVFLLGVANGAFSISAIASMMRLAGQGPQGSEGLRMGLWGAAQAVAFGVGGLVGTASSDLAHWLLGTPAAAYGAVFVFEGVLFAACAALAAQMGREFAAAPRAGAEVRQGPRMLMEMR